jgi:hypothetical protein
MVASAFTPGKLCTYLSSYERLLIHYPMTAALIDSEDRRLPEVFRQERAKDLYQMDIGRVAGIVSPLKHKIPSFDYELAKSLDAVRSRY